MNTRFNLYFKGKNGQWRTGGYFTQESFPVIIKIYHKYKIKSIVFDEVTQKWYIPGWDFDEVQLDETDERVELDNPTQSNS